MPATIASTLVVENHLPADFIARALRQDVITGLTAPDKWLPPRWFYDDRGSELFDEITRLPEYYPTRAERSILRARAAEIAEVSAATSLVELGAGSAEKTHLLVDALRATGSLRTYVPVDVSDAALRGAAAGLLWEAALHEEYGGLAVHAVVADFERHLDRLPVDGHRMVALLGGTIGNLAPPDRARFLHDVRAALRPGETLLLGTDLVKSPDVLVPAYDDAAGVTAQFNRNVLNVLNRELGADFELDAFDHVAVWDARQEWIEMRLRARHAMQVRIPAVELTVDLERGEEIRTEISAKFRREGVAAELSAAGFGLTRWWTDDEGRFGVSLATAG
ncbi:L-histidine N(alpha)-methyltransferase [Cryptosporangium sp. NPDC051539]|uniref:L-histidine N(alpha)-methyltransferase n=1 Tax=Cryptosporangium sp. NPDC051539 TaxID=3363962 RepID=UPI0037950C88